MVTFITGLMIIVYCLINLLDTESFIERINNMREASDAFFIVFIFLWFIVHFFFIHGPIALIGPIVLLLIRTNLFNQKFMLWWIILWVSVIILNTLWFKFNLWQFQFIK